MVSLWQKIDFRQLLDPAKIYPPPDDEKYSFPTTVRSTAILSEAFYCWKREMPNTQRPLKEVNSMGTRTVQSARLADDCKIVRIDANNNVLCINNETAQTEKRIGNAADWIHH